MSEINPPREIVKPDVIDVIHSTMQRFGRPDRDYSKQDLNDDESINLRTQIRLPVRIREALAIPYSKISSEKHGGARVTQSDAKDASTVGKAIDLVHKKANSKRKSA